MVPSLPTPSASTEPPLNPPLPFHPPENVIEYGRAPPMTQTLPEVRFWMITLLKAPDVFTSAENETTMCICEWETLRMNEPDSAGPLSHSLSSLVCFPVSDPVTVLPVLVSAVLNRTSGILAKMLGAALHAAPVHPQTGDACKSR